MTNPKITVALLFLVVLTAIVSLQQEHNGNDVYRPDARVDQSEKEQSFSFLYHNQAEYLEEAFPTRVSSISVSSKDHAAEMQAADFFNSFSRNLADKSYLTGVPLLCRSCQHGVNIHGP